MLKVEHLFDNRPLADALLENWQFDRDDPDRFRHYRISSNAIYPFRKDGELHFLRFAPAGEKRPGSVRAELDFIRYLRANGYPAAEPVESRDGDLVVEQQTQWGGYVASVFRRVPGVHLGRTDLSDDIVFGYGAALGALHRLSAAYDPPGPRRWSYEDVLGWCRETLAAYPDAARAIAEADLLAAHFGALPKAPGTYGLVHYDFECDNTLFDAATNAIGVIDFDDAMEHWYAMDLEQALDSLAEESGRDLSATVLAGYASECPLTEDRTALRPACRRFAALYWYTRTRRAVASIAPGEPAWLVDLRARIGAGMASRAETFGAPLDHP